MNEKEVETEYQKLKHNFRIRSERFECLRIQNYIEGARREKEDEDD